ncbi:MAG: prephenate dehydrogenase [Clostridia bacterium]|nr:prephenate dehydrogenase [Clostridia bacterium]
MLIGIIGLGLIGGSFAKAYSKMGHTVAALEKEKSVLQYAILKDMISAELTDETLKECDLILICTYPKAAIEFLEEKGPLIGTKPVVIDCCGTKRVIADKGMEIAQKYGFTYAGGHPMAGTQYSGVKYSKENMFKDAPMVIVPPRYDDIVLLDKIKKMLLPAGFSQITVTTAEKHDEVIAFTSQLAHVVSSAYIKSPTAREHRGVSAGSYKDMTRVAWLSPEMWTQLCMDNRDNLIKETDTLIENLKAYRKALSDGDAELLRQLFAEGREIKEEVDGSSAKK